jgi:hypothetical protein
MGLMSRWKGALANSVVAQTDMPWSPGDFRFRGRRRVSTPTLPKLHVNYRVEALTRADECAAFTAPVTIPWIVCKPTVLGLGQVSQLPEQPLDPQPNPQVYSPFRPHGFSQKSLPLQTVCT